ncbi:hypothetical protein ABG088_03225 [Hydrogenibacillus schlegelii]|uniref:Uncharacterized protein n=1 Tax=Hydrogenibacillus schlegelii TaxID=1484 RepID=A0A2T5G3S9_HYDSH|nr:hypothetical protein [Hydrogenibacillus schlegelii]PTQ50836.1 MAG: hypothetical protein HSCHL_2495 [Hydrogenibacillus schlegelii]
MAPMPMTGIAYEVVKAAAAAPPPTETSSGGPEWEAAVQVAYEVR